jgi:AcrR family transcriptional regulator
MAGRKPVARQKIEHSLMRLLESKALNEVSVAELAAAAGCTRKTFYMYYADVRHVAMAMKDEMILHLRKELDAISQAGIRNLSDLTAVMDTSFSASRRFLVRLEEAGLLGWVMQDVQELLRTAVIRTFAAEPERLTAAGRAAAGCAASGLLTLYCDYHNAAFGMSIPEAQSIAGGILQNAKNAIVPPSGKGENH